MSTAQGAMPQPKSGFGIIKTPEQCAFIHELSTTNNSICLNAVAGSGKTSTLVLACNEIKPLAGHILALAFNKKNAMDLEKKLPPAVDCMTLNSLGHRAWQQRIGKRLFLNDKKIGEICSKICEEFNCKDNWAAIKNLVVHAKNVGLVPSSVKDAYPIVPDNEEEWEYLIQQHSLDDFPDLIAAARKALTESIKQALEGTIDFSDQLYMTCIFRAKMPQYRTVMVDEAQDLSEIQHELISRCVLPGGRLIAVGDPKQAIYGFRGAHSSSMSILSQRFAMKQMPLSYCFRCPQVVIKMAQSIIPQIQWPEGTITGTFMDYDRKWSLSELKPGSTILCRNIAPLVRMGMECLRASKPCWVAVRDVGAPLLRAAKELKSQGDWSTPQLFQSINDWKDQKRLIANGNLELIARAEDTADALAFVVEVAAAQMPGEIEAHLKALFTKEPESGALMLTTIHRSKGMEWPVVYLLDPWRIPAKFAQRAAENDPQGCAWMLEQERHLRYIAYTRAQRELYFISYEEY